MRHNIALLIADIRDEMASIERLAQEFAMLKQRMLGKQEAGNFYDRAALGYFLHNFYNGCENIFQMIARFFENDLTPQSWHRDLLKRMKLEVPGYRPRLIDETTYETLNEFRAFRHIFRHCYSFQLDWEREKALATKFPALWLAVQTQLTAFIEQMQLLQQSTP